MCKKIIFLALLCLTSILLLSGCSGGSDELQAGYYGQMVMQPNGNFIGKDKIDDKKAATSGLVYKVEMNEQKKLSKITAMYNERPIDIGWFDTRHYQYSNFAVVALEYQDGYVKYNFKDASMQPVTGYYGAYSLRYKLNEKQIPTIAYCYDKDGEQKENADGFAQMLFTYDDTGALIKVGYANSSGERVTTTWKEYEIKFKYDSNNKKNRLPIEVSKREVLLDLLEKRRYQPPATVDGYDSLHGHVKVVGEQGHRLRHLSLLDVHVCDDTRYMVDTALPEHHHLLTVFHQPGLVHIHAVCQHIVLETFLHLGDIDDVSLSQFLELLIVDICTVKGNDLIMLEMAGREHDLSRAGSRSA